MINKYEIAQDSILIHELSKINLENQATIKFFNLTMLIRVFYHRIFG